MATYKLTFENGKKFVYNSCKQYGLPETQSKVVNYMTKNELTQCKIECPNGSVFYVIKTGNWHPIHNGYSFTK
jgi:hypothetical protein